MYWTNSQVSGPLNVGPQSLCLLLQSLLFCLSYLSVRSLSSFFEPLMFVLQYTHVILMRHTHPCDIYTHIRGKDMLLTHNSHSPHTLNQRNQMHTHNSNALETHRNTDTLTRAHTGYTHPKTHARYTHKHMTHTHSTYTYVTHTGACNTHT